MKLTAVGNSFPTRRSMLDAGVQGYDWHLHQTAAEAPSIHATAQA
jgi:hypothetical protein